MIFVALGTQDKSFTRLLDAIQREIDNGVIKEKVIVQAGITKYESDDMEILDLMPKEEFDKYIKECDLLITHGGVGNILSGLTLGKKIIVAPRLSKYKEHINDHQLQITEDLDKKGYILPLYDFNDLGKLIKKAKKFKPKKYKSNNKQFINMLEEYIDNL